MSEYKEFTGKSLDEAIEAACAYYEQERSKLEIEILSGGSSGIFGLVGKKRAVVKAKPRAAMTVDLEAGKIKTEKPAREKPVAEKERERPQRPPKKEARPPREKTPEPVADSEPPAESPIEPVSEPVSEPETAPAPEPRAAAPKPAPKAATPELPLEDKELDSLIREVVGKLVTPLIGEAPLTVVQTPDRIKVIIEDEDQAGIVIGREGQTLNALQYLTNRMVSKQWKEPVKVQLDSGRYRERQDEKFMQMALSLAEKAKAQGRPQSTKPLSSYHRRVVHLALQGDEGVSTRSKGEGPTKRVLILPKRDRRN